MREETIHCRKEIAKFHDEANGFIDVLNILEAMIRDSVDCDDVPVLRVQAEHTKVLLKDAEEAVARAIEKHRRTDALRSKNRVC